MINNKYMLGIMLYNMIYFKISIVEKSDLRTPAANRGKNRILHSRHSIRGS